MPTQMTLSAIVGLLECLAVQRQAVRIAGKSTGEIHRVAWGQPKGLREDGEHYLLAYDVLYFYALPGIIERMWMRW